MTDSMPSFLDLVGRKDPSPFFTGPKAKDYIENMPNFGDIYSPSEKKKSFLEKFIDRGFTQNESLNKFLKDEEKSYRPEEKSSQEKVFDFLSKMGGGGSGFEEVAAGLKISKPDTSARDAAILQQNQQSIADAERARQTKSNVGRMAGSIIGNIIAPGIGGAVGNLIGGIFCDIRLKEDIAPLQKSEVNDVLSECAFFVKDLNECS